MAADARQFLPLKPLVYEILLALSEGERHGWSLVKEIQERHGGGRILPANFYRTLRGMLADGLIEEADPRRGETDERRRYFRISPLGRSTGQSEARRLTQIAADARTRKLLKTRP
jgi:DNA-binding PadR family transcriptional regulator